MKIRMDRIERDFFNISEFGRLDNGGVTRLAFSEADLRARDYLQHAMEAAGLEVIVDGAGNMRGRRAGKESLPAVLMGSHLDTVPNGGHYDGVIGILAALEVARVMDEQCIRTRRPVEVVNFSAEESSRFGVATFGSKALIGDLKDDIDRLMDEEGISLGKALSDGGYSSEDLGSIRLRKGDIHAYLELHIEQGPVLENAGIPVGIVTAIAAPTRFKVIVRGRADHSGTTPMNMRRDALAAASELVLGVESIAGKDAGEHTVGTVGYLRVTPGVMNVIPEQVELGIDLRDIDGGEKKRAVAKVLDLMNGIAARRHVEIEREILTDDDPVPMSGKIIDRLKMTARDADIPFLTLPSGAGHDAMNLARITDAGMIFIPSIYGISHNIAEKSRMEDVRQGTEILLRAVAALADEI